MCRGLQEVDVGTSGAESSQDRLWYCSMVEVGGVAYGDNVAPTVGVVDTPGGGPLGWCSAGGIIGVISLLEVCISVDHTCLLGSGVVDLLWGGVG